MKTKNPHFIFLISAMVIVLMICFYFLVDFWIDFKTIGGASVEEGKKTAEPLIQSIEIYRKQNGTTPPTLDFLVPDYINSIPRSAPRYPFIYKTCYDYKTSQRGYLLEFRVGGDTDTHCAYVSAQKGWQCRDSTPFECKVSAVE